MSRSGRNASDSIVGDRQHVLNPFNAVEALKVKAAAKLADRSHSAMRNWCHDYQIARKIVSENSNWVVSWIALHMLIENNSKALDAYAAGDRTSPLVLDYMKRFEQYAKDKKDKAKPSDGGK